MTKAMHCLVLFFTVSLFFTGCTKSEESKVSSKSGKHITAIEQMWVTFIKEGGFKEDPQVISNTALNLFIEANRSVLTKKQCEELQQIGRCDILRDNFECHIMTANFISEHQELRNKAFNNADETFAMVSDGAVDERNKILLNACKSNVRALLKGIPSQYWPSSRFVLLCVLYPVSGGKEKSSALEKELLRVYLTGVIDNRWNSGKLMKPMEL